MIKLQQRSEVLNRTLFSRFKDSLYSAKSTIALFPDLPADIKRSYFYILYPLNRSKKPLRITDLAESISIASPNITSLVNEMELKGLVLRIPSAKDRRSSDILLTKYGEDILRRYYLNYIDKLSVALENDYDTQDVERTINILLSWQDKVESIVEGINDDINEK